MMEIFKIINRSFKDNTLTITFSKIGEFSYKKTLK